MNINKFVRTITVFCIFSTIMSGSLCFAKTRKPAVAGTFYSKNKKILDKEVSNHINKASVKKHKEKPLGLIVPHAGYPYSGPVAGYAYKLIKSYASDFDTIVILGVNHHLKGFSKNSLFKGTSYSSPLGEIQIDQRLSSRMFKYFGITFNEKAHQREHSIETQIPFIQKTGNFKILPIIIGDYSAKNCSLMADILIKELVEKKEKVLFLASSDFSHFHPYSEANKMDAHALDIIKNLDLKKFAEASYKTQDIELCGYGPSMILMIMAKKLGYNDVEVLKYLNSGDTKGSKSNVVGYASIAFYPGKKTIQEDKPMDKKNKNSLTKEEKIFLLKTARKTLISHIKTNKHDSVKTDNPKFLEKRGAFVTLHQNSELRGCIGYIKPFKPLIDTIVENTINASTNDLRFPPVTAADLDQIDIEISALTVPKEISSIDEIVLGRDGIILKKGPYNSVFLPQVAPEQGWDLETTLTYLAQKAGLGSDAWKKDCTFYTFEAEVFSEKEDL